MKKFVLPVLIITFAFCISSCNKSNSTPAWYLKVKINGSWVEFNTALSNLTQDVLDPYTNDLGLAGDNADRSESFFIIIRSDNQIPAGTYASDDPQCFIDVDYHKRVNNDYVIYGRYSATGRPDSKYTVTITSVTDEEIRGSFTGNYLTDPFNGDVQEVTEGEFVVPREL